MTRVAAAGLVLAVGLVGALALSGCAAVGPNYHLPNGAAASAPAAQAPFREVGQGTSIDPLPPRWWHLYDDAVLDDLRNRRSRPTPTCALRRPILPARAP